MIPTHVQAFLEEIAQLGVPPWYEMSAQKGRDLFASFPYFGNGPELADVTSFAISDIPVRLFRPTNDDDNRVIVYFHGGGWVLGDLDTHDSLCRRLCAATQIPVLSVHYRRAPENPFPAAIDDCNAICRAIVNGQWPFASSRMIVAGDSAGGNLALGVSLTFRDDEGLSHANVLCGQILVYPVVDSSMSLDSYRRYGEGYGLTAKAMAWFWEMYTGKPETGFRDHPLASPLQADLSALVPTFVLTAELDVLRDEGLELVRRLEVAGVEVDHHEEPGMIHGFLHYESVFPESTRCTERIAEACHRMFAK